MAAGDKKNNAGGSWVAGLNENPLEVFIMDLPGIEPGLPDCQPGIMNRYITSP